MKTGFCLRKIAVAIREGKTVPTNIQMQFEFKIITQLRCPTLFCNYELRITNYALNFKGFCKIVHLFVNERIDESSFGGIFLRENFALNADRVEQ